MRAHVVALLGGGATLRGVERGRSIVILGFVDCQFFLLHSHMTFAGG